MQRTALSRPDGGIPRPEVSGVPISPRTPTSTSISSVYWEDRHGPSAGAADHGGGGAPNTARVSARAGPIRASVGTRWEQIGSYRGSRCPLVSLRESGAMQGILDENRGCRAARATAYGTEGQRFESSRARFVSQKIMPICRAFVSVSADACPSLGSWCQDGPAPRRAGCGALPW
jgi:hypothetical protein